MPKQANKPKSSYQNLSDCMCPVCLEIIIDPVILRCSHELCLECFFGVQVKSLNPCCPICRGLLLLKNIPIICPVCNDNFFHIYCTKTHRRIPKKYLVNTPRWKQIKKDFCEEIRKRRKESKAKIF